MIRKVIDRDSAHLWMRENLRFSRYDINFVENVARYIDQGRSLTVKQNDLWEKIVHKYRKQIFSESKGTITDELILDKQWNNPVVEFDPDYAPLLWIKDDHICLRFPYNKDTVADLRRMLQDTGHDYGLISYVHPDQYFSWDKQQRIWHGTAYATLIRDLTEFALDHEFAIDASVKEIVDSVSGDDLDWCPFAELYGDGYMVSNLSPGLLRALPPNEITLDTVRELVGLEVTISDAMQSRIAQKYGVQLGRIACQRTVTVMVDDISALKEYFKRTDHRLVVYHRQYQQYTDATANEEQETLTPTKFVSLADFRAHNKGLGDYYVYSKDTDNYTLDHGIDCVVFMPDVSFPFDALSNIAKKVITVVQNETSTTNN